MSSFFPYLMYFTPSQMEINHITNSHRLIAILFSCKRLTATSWDNKLSFNACCVRPGILRCSSCSDAGISGMMPSGMILKITNRTVSNVFVPGVPKKVLPFEKSPKFDYEAFSKIFVLIPFFNGPKLFGDDKNFVFVTYRV